MMTQDSTIFWVQGLTAFSVLLQSLEIFQLRHHLADSGLWTWPILKEDFKDFPRPLFWFFDKSLSYPAILILVGIQLLAALATLLFPHGSFNFVLLMSCSLITIRWRGSFNGGSDSMTLLTLGALTVASISGASSKVALGALWYITIQGCLSYIMAGWVKLKESTWRNGQALEDFLLSSHYPIPNLLKNLSPHRGFHFVVAWIIIIFECSFPFILFFTDFKIEALVAGALFHLANVYVFGLNRFFWAWLATYPALYFCSLNN